MAQKENRSIAHDLERFYSLLERLREIEGQGRPLKEYTGRSKLPRRGVYFFFEPGEPRTTGEGDRVVRVGTHALHLGAASTLWQRLRSHRGGAKSGGNHRGSIFRLEVGRALLARDSSELATWGLGQSAVPSIRIAERDLENEVSRFIGAMRMLWLEVDDEPSPVSKRSYIEQNSIALLSNRTGQMDMPGPDWLGRFSPQSRIRESGLWNKDYVFGEYDRAFLDVMAALSIVRPKMAERE